MIIDVATTPEPYEIFADNFCLNHWQKGVVGDLFCYRAVIQNATNLSTHHIKLVNMGRGRGHTFLAAVLALKEFDIRTKVYGPCIIHPNLCHEPVDDLHESRLFNVHQGNPVELVVIDFSNQPLTKYQSFMDKLLSSLPITTMVLLLQPAILTQEIATPW